MNVTQHIQIPGNFGRYHNRDAVVWSTTDIVGMFIDAQERGEFGTGKIVEYRQDGVDGPIRAVVWHKDSRTFSVHEFDMEIRKPRQVWGIRVKRRKRRPRESRESKIKRAERRWYER